MRADAGCLVVEIQTYKHTYSHSLTLLGIVKIYSLYWIFVINNTEVLAITKSEVQKLVTVFVYFSPSYSCSETVHIMKTDENKQNTHLF